MYDKPYLVDVPVKINVWIRPECQRKQFDIIKQARPSILFIQSDGGRTEDEWEKIYINRKMIEEAIDWDCKVYKLYESTNLGLYTMAQKTRKFIWSIVDRCIFLEDDHLPCVSFFRFCAELLEKYKDDERIECICGTNILGEIPDIKQDYFFSQQGSIAGVAFWKRTENNWGDFSYANDKYNYDLLKYVTRETPNLWKRIVAYGKSEVYEGHIAFTEFNLAFDIYARNRLFIVPTRNMISNIGATSDSAHAEDIATLPKASRMRFNQKTYDMEFPLVHNDFIIPNAFYKNKVKKISSNNIFKRTIRKFEHGFLLLRHGNLNQFNKLLKNKITNKERIES